MEVRRMVSIFAALAFMLVMASSVAATGHLVGGETDYSADLITSLVGLVAGIAASIAVGVAVAGLVRATWKGARAALKAFSLIK